MMMNAMKKFLGTLLVLTVLQPYAALPCTTFRLKNGDAFIFGRNYDWEVESAYIIVNKRNVAKTALLNGPGTPAQWSSKYGSVTFNQYGREFPLGGMNEAGLVIELMELRQGEYPLADKRPAVVDLQWIQYQLDTATTVRDVISTDRLIRIDTQGTNPIHFLLSDRQGGAAVIEFLSGHMRVRTGKDLPIAALTNNTYAYGLELYDLCRGDETNPAFKQASYSLKRFVWAANGVKAWDVKPDPRPVEYAFGILKKAAVERTVFSIVYDAGSGLIHFRTRLHPEIRVIDTRKFDYACASPVKILDIQEPLQGDVTAQFKDYSWEANYDLIKKSFGGTSFLKNMPDEMLRNIARYPGTQTCK